MIIVLLIVIVLLAAGLAAVAGRRLKDRGRRLAALPAIGARRILFPFMADALSQRALDAALRLARAEDAVLVPVFLARVSMQLPLDTPLPRQCGQAISLQEAIEQRATASGIAVDARIERGRTYRHALRQTIGHERFDRIVVAAASQGSPGFNADDVAWLLDNSPGEIVVLRPDRDEPLGLPEPKVRRGRRPRPVRVRHARRGGRARVLR
ncbi:MAG: universal stress protein [Actinomycetota bacterium]|nr:universal stress protein [Actinomycetota bacterium]